MTLKNAPEYFQNRYGSVLLVDKISNTATLAQMGRTNITVTVESLPKRELIINVVGCPINWGKRGNTCSLCKSYEVGDQNSPNDATGTHFSVLLL